MTQKIAADFGFGFCKFVCDGEVRIIPTAVAEMQSADIIDGKIGYKYNDQVYLVGTDAVRNALPTRDYSYLERYAPLFLFYACESFGLDLNQPIEVSTGLSLLEWRYIQQFAAKLSQFTVNNTTVNKIKIRATPQGKGAFLLAKKQHPELNNQLVLLIDFGTYTCNTLFFDSGRALVDECSATYNGMHLLIKAVRNYLNSQHGLNVGESDANKLMQLGYVNLLGEKVDLTELIQIEAAKYFKRVIDTIINTHSELYKRVETIVCVGGGVNFAANNLTDKRILMLNSPQLANVYGYWSVLNET